jgi:hypothetical protein
LNPADTEDVTVTDRQLRYGVTRRKHLTLTVVGHDQIARWAEDNNLSFSAAIEALALQTLEAETLTISAVLLRSMVYTTVRSEFQKQFNRFAKLAGMAALGAHESSLKLDALLLQIIRQEAEKNTEFHQTMSVSTDPTDQQAARIRQFRDRLSSLAKNQAIDQLRKPLAEVELLLAAAAAPDEE